MTSPAVTVMVSQLLITGSVHAGISKYLIRRTVVGNRKYLFVIQGYTGGTEGRLMDVCFVRLVNFNAEAALAEAKTLIDKPMWRVAEIIEQKENDEPVQPSNS